MNLGVRHGLKAAVFAALAAASTGLFAAPVTYQFSASNFTSYYGGTAPDSISGSFTLDGTTVTHIDLTLGTHTFTADEVELNDPESFILMLGARINETHQVGWGTNDFWLRFWPTGEFFEFAFSTDATVEYYKTNTGTMTVVSSVPVPAAAWLFGTGLIGLAGIARRRR